MAHYAFLDENNIVTHVIVGKDENEDGIDWEQQYSLLAGQVCKRTSYNTLNNQHVNGGTPFRGNYASVGYTYNEELDVFIPPKPFNSWLFDEEICGWVAPTPKPNEDYPYIWNERNLGWGVRQLFVDVKPEQE